MEKYMKYGDIKVGDKVLVHSWLTGCRSGNIPHTYHEGIVDKVTKTTFHVNTSPINTFRKEDGRVRGDVWKGVEILPFNEETLIKNREEVSLYNRRRNALHTIGSTDFKGFDLEKLEKIAELIKS